MTNHSKTLKIEGMHCPSCELLLENEVVNIEGIIQVKVLHKKGVMHIEFSPYLNASDQKVLIQEVISTIEKYDDYTVVQDHPYQKAAPKNKPEQKMQEWLTALGIVGALGMVYMALKRLGLLDSLGGGAEINYISAFAIGIIASMSSCLAVVGSLVISFSAQQKSRDKQQLLHQHIKFHAGRLASFFLLGGVLGLIGGTLSLTSNATFIMTMLTAMVMFYLGLSTLGFVPSIASLGLRFPRLTWHDNQGLRNKNMGALMLGASTFFLPCGFTQSMQIFALGSHSAWQGALTLFLFALGTVPVLFGAGYFTSTLVAKKSGIFTKTAGLLILLFSLTIVNNALAIKGKQINLASGNNSETTAQPVSITIPDSKQIVQMDVLARSFSPNVLVVQKDIPIKWIINGDQASGCTNEIIVPAYNLRQKISPGENIIEFTPTTVGDINFSCWMGMVHGIIRVVEATR